MIYAAVRDQQIVLTLEGRPRPVTRWEAVGALTECDGSFIPESQERARQIRAALIETRPS